MLALGFCVCFALVMVLCFRFSIRWAWSQVWWLALGGISLSLSLFVWSCPCLSLSCVGSCCRLVGSKSCSRLLVLAFGRCLSLPLKLPSPSVARVLPCSSWLVHACLRCWGGVGGCGGGFGFHAPCPGVLLRLVSCLKLPLVASRWCLVPSLDHHCAFASFAFRSVSCSDGRFVLLGGTCRPGCFVSGEGLEGCRAQMFRRVAFGVYVYSKFVPMAAVLADNLYCYIVECCDDGVDEMADIIALIDIISGLRHAGDEHTSSLPDSATYSTPARPRSSKFPEIHGRQIDCLMQEHRLYVAKALGHPKPIGAGCPLGEGIGGAIRLTNALGLRTQRPEQQPGEPHSPLGLRLGIRETGSGEVPPRIRAHDRTRGELWLAARRCSP